VALPPLDQRFYWTGSPRCAVLTWDGLPCGWVDREGNWRADWRGHRHAGWLPTQRLARRMMERWFAARQYKPPRDKRSRRTSMEHLWWPVQDFLAGERAGFTGVAAADDELLF